MHGWQLFFQFVSSVEEKVKENKLNDYPVLHVISWVPESEGPQLFQIEVQ